MSDFFRLDGQLALVTGGGSGIGFAIAKEFLAAGAPVTIAGRNRQRLDDATQQLGSECRALPCDVAQPDASERLREAMGQSPDIIVHCAGIHLKKTAAETTREDFEAVFATNVFGGHDISRAFLTEMRARKSGSILFVSSMAAYLSIPLVSAYSASKSAITGLVLSLAAEVSADGIRVNAIAPGWIETEMLRKAVAQDEARKEKILSRTPMGRFGKPEEVVRAARFLCSPAGSFINSVILPVDGGAVVGF